MRITSPELPDADRRVIAARLTDAVIDLWYQRRAPVTRDELRERTTVHFTPYAADELFIGGRSTNERGATDVSVELSDWSMSVRHQRRAARTLTPLLCELFRATPSDVNLRFHSYPPTDFAVAGMLLSQRIPWIGRVMKSLFD